MEITSESQFVDALNHASLSVADLKVLDALFLSPDSTASASELASFLKPEDPSPIIASGAIGRVGKKFSKFLKIDPGTYTDNGIDRPAYFYMIGKYGEKGWVMWDNLRSAMERKRYGTRSPQENNHDKEIIEKTKSRNPKWHRDEIILALNLYFDPNRGPIDKSNPKIVELSNILNKLPLFPDRPDEEKFRNANGVTLKLSNFMPFDPLYRGKGMEGGSKLDKIVFDEFASNREELKSIANQIKLIADDPVTKEKINHIEDDDMTWKDEVVEGQIIYKLHKTRERDRGIVADKKSTAMTENGKLDCEACLFDFYRHYGDLGHGFIECHHRTPLNQFKVESKTKLVDLALVCSNCHRMLHRQISTLTVENLGLALEKENKRFLYS